MSAPFRLLVVCEGNVCRSPWAEVLVRGHVGPDAAGRFRVASAGTHAAPGRRADPRLRALCATDRQRAEVGRHRSRRADVALLRAQDLVVVMERRHRQDLLDGWPEGLRRVVTLGEAEQLARIGPPTCGESELPVHELFAHRRSPAVQRSAEDVPDPVRGTEQDFADMGQRVRRMVDAFMPVVVAAVGVHHDREER
jgi:protein-tyrosine phosphatase